MSHPHLSFTVFSAEARLAFLGSCSILVTDFGFLMQISLCLKLDTDGIALV